MPESNDVSTQPPSGVLSPRRYRVLMIAPTSFFADYGCHVRILEEARILQKLGHSVTIATYHNGRNVPGVDVRRTLPIPWRQHYEVGSSRHKLVLDALLGLKTLRLLAGGLLSGGRYDVIHAHLHEGALIGQVLGRPFGTPTLFDFQGSLTGEMIDHNFLRRDGRLHRALRRLETWLDRRSPVIFTNSANARRVLIEEYGCAPHQLRALPDCVSADTFVPAGHYAPGELLDLRRRLLIPDGHKVIVYLGLLAEYQGTGHLLEAMRRVVAEHPQVTLLLMGFPGVDVYRQRARDLGVGDHVIFTGRIPYEDAPRYLALGDAAVAPKLSLTEGAGKLLNYMAVALPTVAFDTPVAHEYLGPHGFFAARGDAAALADQLCAALFDTERAAHAGQQARVRAIRHYDWQWAGEEIAAAYAEVVGGAAQRKAPRRLGEARAEPGIEQIHERTQQ